MKSRGGPVAVALAAGYLLGRGHRLRWALALGAAASMGRLGGRRGLGRAGVEALRAAPELARFAAAGGPLVSAGRAALRAAADSRVEAWTGRLEQATEALRRPDGTDRPDGTGLTAARPSGGSRRRRPRARAAGGVFDGGPGEEAEDDFDENDADDRDRLDDRAGDEEFDEAPSGGGSDDAPDEDEPDDEPDDEPEDESDDGPDDESDDGPDDQTDDDPDDELDDEPGGDGSDDDEFDDDRHARSGRGRTAGGAARRQRAAGPPRQRANARGDGDEGAEDGGTGDRGARRGNAARRPAVSRSSNEEGRATVRRERR